MVEALPGVSILTGPILDKEASIERELNVAFADTGTALVIRDVPVAEPEVECAISRVMQTGRHRRAGLFQDLLELRLFPQGCKVRVFCGTERQHHRCNIDQLFQRSKRLWSISTQRIRTCQVIEGERKVVLKIDAPLECNSCGLVILQSQRG